MDGSYLFGSQQSSTKIIQVLPDPIWKVTTDSIDTVNVTSGIIQGIDYGIKGVKDEHNIKISITPTIRARCDRTSRHQLTFHNNGTLVNKGTVNYYKPSVVSFDSASPPPTNINGNVYSWNYDSLYPGTARNIDVYVTNPPGIDIEKKTPGKDK